MIALTSQSTINPTMVGVLKRYWPLVVVGSLVLGALSVAVPALTPDSFAATATLVVEDPSAATLFGSLENGSASDAERYVNDQAAILASTPIATAALANLDEGHAETPKSSAELLEHTLVIVDDASNVIEVRYSSNDPDFSIVAVNSILSAYEGLVEVRGSAVYADAIVELDASISVTRQEIDGIQAEILALLRGSEGRQELDDQFRVIVDRLAALQRGRITADGTAAADIAVLTAQLAALQAVNDVEQALPELKPLIDRRTEAIQRESQLISRRDGLAVDAQLQRSGLALLAPAISAQAVGRSPVLTGMAGLLLGAVLGMAAAYWLSGARRRFEDRLQPQEVLDVPLLGEIPRIAGQSGGRDALPVLDAPDSPSAHAFRALAGVVQQNIPSLRVTPGAVQAGATGADRGAVLAIVSATENNGKSVVAINTAAAAARNGLRVLVIDGDLINRGASKLLLAGQIEKMDSSSSEPVTCRVVVDEKFGVDILGWGSSSGTSSDVLSSKGFQEQVSNLSENYDLILLDLPALLNSAPATDAVRLADSAVLVIPHHSLAVGAEDLRYRLNLIGTSSLGYVYTHPVGSPSAVAVDLPTDELASSAG